MQKFWSTLVWLWVNYSPWLVLSFLPSVIAGLSVSPKTQPAANVVQKILDFLKKIIELLSFLTFKDEPGTFQLPLKIAKRKKVVVVEEPKVEEKKDDPTAPPPPPLIPPAASILLILSLSVPNTGCCKLFGACGDDGIKQDIIDCTTQAAMTNAAHLLPIVKEILTGSGEWSKKLWDLIKEFGRDAVACAMQQVGQDLLMSVPPEGTTPTPEQQAALEGVKRARQFTAEQKWQYKK